MKKIKLKMKNLNKNLKKILNNIDFKEILRNIKKNLTWLIDLTE